MKKIIKPVLDFIANWKHRNMKGARHIRLGRLGEDLAVNELKANGYKISERNAKVYKREVDVIAMDGDMIVFVEVKSRSGHRYGRPIEAIDNKRKGRLRKAAELYLAQKKIKGASVRFDVVTVDYTDSPKPKIEIVKNAF
ncbi:hypothetical protein MNBD_NITROSPINAE02-357 [hydrothermal vent metagenome]|uniref:Uncharacterized protein n=1 Tax=hydrothermal vent metagenome TaxID=652676 RepID=A0A3B1C6B1_9ZZZZ